MVCAFSIAFQDKTKAFKPKSVWKEKKDTPLKAFISDRL